MNSDTPSFMARTAGNSILWVLTSFPIACFSGALATDIAYARTADMIWADFSAWLLAVGMVAGVLAAIAAVVRIIANRRTPGAAPGWPLVVGGLLVLIVALFDNLVHSRDAWTSVVPLGVALSAVIVVIMLATTWLGSAKASKRGASIYYSGARQ